MLPNLLHPLVQYYFSREKAINTWRGPQRGHPKEKTHQKEPPALIT